MLSEIRQENHALMRSHCACVRLFFLCVCVCVCVCVYVCVRARARAHARGRVCVYMYPVNRMKLLQSLQGLARSVERPWI